MPAWIGIWTTRLPSAEAFSAALGRGPCRTDDVERLTRLLDHDPGALLVAEVEGRAVGSIIDTWDGRRGSVYRLVVHPAQRRRGIARRLLSEAEARPAGLGAKRLQAIVVESGDRALAYWRASEWCEQAERVRFVKG